jgi:sugar phosphate permease
MSATTLPSPMEQAVFRKIAWRIAPILMLSYFGCYLDRANVGFAALTMNQDLGLTATAGAVSDVVEKLCGVVSDLFNES